MNPVVHFEMPYDDAARLARFYADAFGWKTQGTGPDMGHYVLAFTCETGADGRPRTPGAINGGFYPRSAAPGPALPSFVIAVEDLAAAMDKVRAAGGQVHGEPMDIPGVGRFVPFTDSEGNRASMLQPLMR